MLRGRAAGILMISVAYSMLLSIPVSGATYHVSPLGSDTPPYTTYQSAAHRVADAANLATTPGDTVLVHTGSYTSTDTIYIALGVTFAGVGRDSVTIIWGDGESAIYDLMVSLAGGNEVYGIEFRYPQGVDIDWDDVTALRAYAGQPMIVRDCRISGARVHLDGDTRFDVLRNDFRNGKHRSLFIGGRNCWVHGNEFLVSNSDGRGTEIWAWLADTVMIDSNQFLAEVDQYSNPFAIEIEECDTAVVRNNLIRNCYASIIWSETDGLIENNTMIHADPDWFASFEVFQGATDQVTIRNNVFVDMERPIAWGPQGGVDTAGLTTFVHNVFWPPRDTLYKMYPPGVTPARFPLIESLSVFTFPMFAEESTYCPQSGSPLIDAGDPTLADVDLSRSDIGWHGGPGGFLCAYLDSPPLPPDSLWLSGEGGLVTLAWSPRPEADLQEYRVYRGTSSGFWIPGMLAHRIAVPPDTIIVDTLLSAGDSYYYVVTGVDTAGLESDPSVERSYIVSGVFDDPAAGDVPRSPRLLRVYPNPFNASTQIEVEVTSESKLPLELTITVFDVLGRSVSTRRAVITFHGTSSFAWDARTDSGQPLASGVYFLRLTAGESTLNPIVQLVVMK